MSEKRLILSKIEKSAKKDKEVDFYRINDGSITPKQIEKLINEGLE